ncbi:hypothetical protein SK128_020599 [Halocaridina rubra]|uniref:Uncharacterized protein n=1 Tax=Halocaridina rubra TaxID=373956 RepID=A0AAN9A3A6_HALRR
MQHIVVRTGRPENLEAPDWQKNGVGRHVSHSFYDVVLREDYYAFELYHRRQGRSER